MVESNLVVACRSVSVSASQDVFFGVIGALEG